MSEGINNNYSMVQNFENAHYDVLPCEEGVAVEFRSKPGARVIARIVFPHAGAMQLAQLIQEAASKLIQPPKKAGK